MGSLSEIIHLSRNRSRFLWIVAIICFIILFISFALYQHSLLSTIRRRSPPLTKSQFENTEKHKMEQHEEILNDERNNANKIQQTKTNNERDKTFNQNTVRDVVTQPNTETIYPFHPYAHIFYYAWYRNEKIDGKYEHWNHKVLPHWTKHTNDQYNHLIGKPHDPRKMELATNFFPSRGAYSSTDRETVLEQFKEIRKANVHVIVLSWWGVLEADENGSNTEIITPFIMKCAEEVGLQVIFHMEPYAKRSAESIKRDVMYVIDTYGKSSAFFKFNGKPLFYFYDSYILSSEEWRKILSPESSQTLRNTPYDAIFIGLYLNSAMRNTLKESNFDGFYTYFAADRFTEGSTSSNWKEINEWASSNYLLFIPSVAPGYIDEKIRPWNSANTKPRNDGKYYENMFNTALSLTPLPSFITITSYNEWHEGTQIELAIPKNIPETEDLFSRAAAKYLDYLPHDPDYYLKLTADYVQKYVSNLATSTK
nr:unnamed protein product [Naegleria fowleri]